MRRDLLPELLKLNASESAVPGVAVREATVADCDRMAELVGELGYPTSAGQMRRRLEGILRHADYKTLVACKGGEILGFVGTRVVLPYESDEPHGQIMALAVAANHRRIGIGRLLMLAAESGLRERGARVCVLTSGNHRAGAHAFYESQGYFFTGRRYKKAFVTD